MVEQGEMPKIFKAVVEQGPQAGTVNTVESVDGKLYFNGEEVKPGDEHLSGAAAVTVGDALRQKQRQQAA